MLVDCMFYQPYRSLIESQNGCLDNSNPNSVIGSTANQCENQVRVDIPIRRFSLSFISVVNLSMTFFVFFFYWLISVVSFFLVCCRFWCDFAGVQKFNFRSFINIGMANPPYLVGREISTLSLPLRKWHSRGSSKWRMFGMDLKK